MQKGKPAKKYSQAGRLHTIIRLLEARRNMTLDDLAEECDVDRRTIHRDLNAVQEAGYTLTSDWQDGKKGGITRLIEPVVQHDSIRQKLVVKLGQSATIPPQIPF